MIQRSLVEERDVGSHARHLTGDGMEIDLNQLLSLPSAEQARILVEAAAAAAPLYEADQVRPPVGRELTALTGLDGERFQARSVSLQRFVEQIGTLPEERVTRIATAISLCMGSLGG